MAEYTFYHNPMSRGWIASWALTEVGADYEIVLVDWGAKPQALLDANPMGKVPTLVHHHGDHDHVITEAAAICHYLATTHPDCGLLPDAHEAAAYYRWLFFAAGPVEAAVTARSMGWEVAEDKIGMAGFGTYNLVVDTLDEWLAGHDHVCGDRFTIADIKLYTSYKFLSKTDKAQAASAEEFPAFVEYIERISAKESAKLTAARK